MYALLFICLTMDIALIIIFYSFVSENIEETIESYVENGYLMLGIGDSSIMEFLKKNKTIIKIIGAIFFPIWWIFKIGLDLGNTIFINKTKNNFDSRIATYIQ